MQLKSSRPTLSIPTIPALIRILAATVFFTALIGIFTGLYMLREISPHRFNSLKKLPGQIPGAVMDYFASIGVNEEHLYLDVKHLDYRELGYQRSQALNVFDGKDFDYVPGQLTWKGEAKPVELRLKGDRFVHFKHHNKWSFRVKVKDGQAIEGMRRFSLHRAGARNYVYEWLLHELLRKEGFASLRYKFIRVHLNGEDLGLYAMEEHFDKEVLESNGFREGPILRLDETNSGHILRLGEFLPYRDDIWTKDEKRPQLEKAVALLEGFRRGELLVSEVFDAPKLARFFALTDVLRMNHAQVWKSMRFYFNPVTGKLEPIGYDGHVKPDREEYPTVAAEVAVLPSTGWYYQLYQPWYELIFNHPARADTAFLRAYYRELVRVSETTFLNSFLAGVHDELIHHLALIKKDFPPFADHTHYYGPDIFEYTDQLFYDQQIWIRDLLYPPWPVLRAFRNDLSGDSLKISLVNISTLPLSIRKISMDSLDFFHEKNVFLRPANQNSPPVSFAPSYEMAIPLPGKLTWHDSMWQQLTITYSVWGVDSVKEVPVYPWQRAGHEKYSFDAERLSGNTSGFGFLIKNEADREIVIERGKWTVNRPMILPEGYKIVAGAGVELNMVEGGQIICRSALNWQGSDAEPVRMYSSDSTGKGILVLQAQDTSVLRNVVFSHLSPPSSNGWNLTGAVTFYESPVQVIESVFEKNPAEDGLNIIRSGFYLEKTRFSDCYSDALDIDFGKGEIHESSVWQAGNDGFDFSGSEVVIHHCFISKANDKAVSIGEGSTVSITELEATESNLGIAVKDLSEIIAENVYFRTLNIGFSAYCKKPVYGGGKLEIKSAQFEKVGRKYLIENSSVAILDGAVLPAEGDSIAQKIDPD